MNKWWNNKLFNGEHSRWFAYEEMCLIYEIMFKNPIGWKDTFAQENGRSGKGNETHRDILMGKGGPLGAIGYIKKNIVLPSPEEIAQWIANGRPYHAGQLTEDERMRAINALQRGFSLSAAAWVAFRHDYEIEHLYAEMLEGIAAQKAAAPQSTSGTMTATPPTPPYEAPPTSPSAAEMSQKQFKHTEYLTEALLRAIEDGTPTSHLAVVFGADEAYIEKCMADLRKSAVVKPAKPGSSTRVTIHTLPGYMIL